MKIISKYLSNYKLDFVNFRKSYVDARISSICISPKIILLGPPKSGSTAIAAILARRVNLPVTLDITRSIPDLGWRLTTKFALTRFEDFVHQYSKEFSRPIIKEPALTFYFDDLKRLFLKAKFVMIQRDPLDNIRSILHRLKIPGNLDNIAFDDWPELIKTPVWRLSLDSTWLGFPSQNYIASLAHQWNLIANIYLDNQDSFVLVRYEDFNHDKALAIDRLAEMLGIDVAKPIINFLDKQYQPKGSASVDLKAFFGSRNINKISEICAINASKIGYNDY